MGRPKGFAYVEYESEEQAQEAVKEIDHSRIGGRVLNVMVANSMKEKKAESQSTVHVSNIPF